MRWIAPLLLLAATACSQPAGAPPAPEPTGPATAGDARPEAGRDRSVVPEGSRRIAAVGDLAGEYRVAGIDGAELQAGFGVALSIDGPMLSFEPTCAGFVWSIAEDAGAFAFARAPGFGPSPQPDGSVLACAVAVPPELRQLGSAIDGARRAWRTPANGVLLEGGGRSVLLFSQ